MNLNGTSPWVRFLNLSPPVEVAIVVLRYTIMVMTGNAGGL